MPATAAQVFGPVTVNPGFNTTGEKTLLTMNTTLPAGGKNVIIATYLDTTGAGNGGGGTFRIKKDTTILYETKISPEAFLWYSLYPATIIAIDDAPAGNDTYTFTANVTTAASSSAAVHVQAIVIKADDAVYAANSTAVSVANGQTATVLSLNTNFPSGSKVVVIGVLHALSSGNRDNHISAGNIRLKAGTTVVASNQFKIGSWGAASGLYFPLYCPLVFFHTVEGPVTYSIEIYNDSGYTHSCYAMLVAFTVSDGAFLDTGSVALVNGSQVTVGNLATALQGDVAAIAFAAAENTTGSAVRVFYANDIVFQKDNSVTGQIANQVDWWLWHNGNWVRAGIASFFRFDTNVTNPSYQIKMTARANGINGEAKIVAFTVAVIEVKTITDSGTGVESVTVFANISVDESGYGAEAPGLRSLIPAGDAGLGADAPVLESAVPVSDEGAGFDFATAGFRVEFHDSGAGVEEVETAKEAKDAGSGAELVNMSRTVVDAGSGTDIIFSPQLRIPADHGTGTEMPAVATPVTDAGSGIEKVGMVKESVDTGSGLDYLSLLGKEITDTGAGDEKVSMAKEVGDAGLAFEDAGMSKVLFDAGFGIDLVNMLKEIRDSGLGLDFTPLVGRGASDSGLAVELLSVASRVSAADHATGADTVGIFATVHAFDTGQAAELADVQLSIYGSVFIDDVEVVGSHSIPYKDYIRDGLPIQVQRHAVDDRVYIDSEFIGDVLVEWEDKIADVVRGRRALTVMGVVKIVD